MTDAPQPAAAAEYERCFESTWDDSTPVSEVRFVVLDTETTGLDPRRDRIITIGAVAVCGGQILLEDCFEAMLHIPYNLSSVTVHGITRDQAREGYTEAEAMEALLPYLRDGVIVGHHISHDVAALDAACQRTFGIGLRNRFLDTMDLTLHLEQDGAFPGHEFRSFTLDALCEFFSVTPHDRHTAGGDALLTALVFLRLVRLAARHGRGTLGKIAERFEAEQ
ncbi:MAG: 3'-5' exonuclease [Bryobacteraceae bacterium]